MLGLEKEELKFVNYNPEWQKLFEKEKKLLQSVIGNNILEIQHIGSTSIPGILAKPILDIGIAVDNFEAAAICIKPLAEIGYTYNGESGIPRRHWFAKGNPVTHHVHILEIDSQTWNNNLIFRDYLTQNPEIAREYAELKLKLLKEIESDREAYQQAKSPFIDRVLQQAKHTHQ
jgi:GrpB-like predicted nucleotidyltransferase (UPF0157 family)